METNVDTSTADEVGARLAQAKLDNAKIMSLAAMMACDQSFYSFAGPRSPGATPGGIRFARNAAARATYRSRNGGK